MLMILVGWNPNSPTDFTIFFLSQKICPEFMVMSKAEVKKSVTKVINITPLKIIFCGKF